jgi:hypothetical protein
MAWFELTMVEKEIGDSGSYTLAKRSSLLEGQQSLDL